MTNTEETMRDRLIAANPADAGMIMSRDQIVEKWCADNGKDKTALLVADVLAIRALPQWKHVG